MGNIMYPSGKRVWVRYILPIPPTRGYRIPNRPPGPSPKWPGTMRPDGFFVSGVVPTLRTRHGPKAVFSCRAGTTARLAHQARPARQHGVGRRRGLGWRPPAGADHSGHPGARRGPPGRRPNRKPRGEERGGWPPDQETRGEEWGRPDRETMGEERGSTTGSRPPLHAPARGAAPHPGCEGGWGRSRKGWVGAWGGSEIGRAGVATGSGVSQREVSGTAMRVP
jgi:hypothetical protein